MKLLNRIAGEGISAASTWLLALTMAAPSLLAQSAQACGVCHRATHKEWTRSAHAQAWSNENFQSQLAQFGSREFCGACHAPQTVWQQVSLLPDEDTGQVPTFQALLAKRATARSEDLQDGVSCSSCHLIEVVRPESKGNDFIGPYHTEEGHEGTEVADFRSFRLCAACHGRPAEDYRPQDASPGPDFHHSQARAFQFAFGKSECGSCHMPARKERLVQFRSFKHLPERWVGEHTFSGERYENLGEALAVTLEGNALHITNAKVGHPLQVWPTSRYRVVLSRLQGEEVADTATVELEGAGGLNMGDAVQVAVPFPTTTPGSVKVEIVHMRDEERVVFSRVF